VTLRRTRIIYQLAASALFFWFIAAGVMGLAERYPTELFLNLSPLAGLSTILSQGNLAGGMILGAGILALAFMLGRVFCGWLCPMGACQDAASFLLVPGDRRLRYAKHSYHPLQKAKYVVLATVLVGAGFGVIWAGWVDPIALMTRFSATVLAPLVDLVVRGGRWQQAAFQGAALTAIVFLATLVMNWWRPRFWCRMVCPLGALLSLCSRNPLRRPTRDRTKCIDCGRCREHCPGACEIDKDVIPSECVMCMNCLEVCPTRAIALRFSPSAKRAAAPLDAGRGLALSRRHFLVSAVVALGSLGAVRNLRHVLGRGFDKRIRPPGALAEEHFLARCIRCGACMNACPTRVIQPAVTECDAEGLWTPVLNMRVGYCEYECVRCTQVCPTEALRPITLRQKHEENFDKIGTAFIDRNRCLPWSFGKECLVCQEVCPVSPKAIYQIPNSTGPRNEHGEPVVAPVVNPERCIGCGHCEYHCPVQDLPAIRVSSIGESRSTNRKLIL